MKRLLLLAAALAAALVLGSCGNKGSPADYPKDFKVTGGDSSATITFTAEPDVDYWIFYGPGPNITTNNWATSGGRVITSAKSPTIVTGLANGIQWSFTMNGRKDKGPGGSGAPTQVVIPVLAGENWATNPPLGTKNLKTISTGTGALGFGIVIAGEGGAIYSSVAGGPMTPQTNPLAPADLNTVFYGSLGWIAGGANGNLLYSVDATTWTQKTSGTTATVNGGTASISQYVGVTDGGVALTSSDGSSWSTQNTGATVALRGAAFGNLRYVVVGDGGTIVWSTDGASWVSASSGTTKNLRAVSYGLVPVGDGTGNTTNAYVAVGDGGTVLLSTDAVTWALVPSFTTADLRGIVNGGRFVAVGAGGVIFTSLDGATWQAQSSPTTNDLNAVARTLSGYTAVGAAGTNISTF